MARGGKTKPGTIPLFDAIRPYLEVAFEAAEEGAVHLITRYRSANANLRTQLLRILEDASLPAWPRPFHNRRQTEKEPAVSPASAKDTAVMAASRYPHGESNPGFRTENPTSWATRRWGRVFPSNRGRRSVKI